MHYLERNLNNALRVVEILKGKGYFVASPTMLVYVNESIPYIGSIDYFPDAGLAKETRQSLTYPDHIVHNPSRDGEQVQHQFNVWLDEKVVIGIVDAQHAKAASLIRMVESIKTMAAELGISDNGINPLDFLLAEVKNNLLPAPPPKEETEDEILY